MTPARDDRRTRVLDAALAAAAEAAPGPVRVADIAARAEMSPGHVMYYFERRDRIVVETLLYAEEQLSATRDRALARAVGPAEAVDTLVGLYLPKGRSDPRWRLWAQVLASAPEDRESRSAVGALVDGWSSALAEVIVQGVADGAMTCPDPVRTANAACRLMDGYALEVLLGGPGRSRTWALREVRGWLAATLGYPGEANPPVRTR